MHQAMAGCETTKQVKAIVAGLVIVASTVTDAVADNAAVLPAGTSRVYGDLYHYLPTTQRYNPDGEREDIAHPFTNAALDSNVLTNLKPLDPLVGGTASIGGSGLGFGAAPPAAGGAPALPVPLIADFPVPSNFGPGFGPGSGSALDIALGSIFVNFAHGGEQVDAARWPQHLPANG